MKGDGEVLKGTEEVLNACEKASNCNQENYYSAYKSSANRAHRSLVSFCVIVQAKARSKRCNSSNFIALQRLRILNNR